ncbi:MAG: plasmid pRiA4b ORF-3 family protein [Gammaproteobacteria bacterium]
MSVKQLRSIYQIKVSLNGVKPPIWRRLLVPGNLTLGRFHEVLQISMGWTNSHLHQFISDGVFYGKPDEELDFGMEVKNEDKFKLSQLLKKEKDSLVYEYDFGDGWEHKVTLEKILPYDNKAELPKCIKGKRACPPEDCGGIWGYSDLLRILNVPENPEHEDMREWLGGDFDSEALDLGEINALLAEYCR